MGEVRNSVETVEIELLTAGGAQKLTSAEVFAYRARYGNWDAEIGRIAIWLVRNPAKRPKRLHVFLRNWFEPRRPRVSKSVKQRASVVALLTGAGKRAEVIDVDARRVG